MVLSKKVANSEEQPKRKAGSTNKTMESDGLIAIEPPDRHGYKNEENHEAQRFHHAGVDTCFRRTSFDMRIFRCFAFRLVSHGRQDGAHDELVAFPYAQSLSK